MIQTIAPFQRTGDEAAQPSAAQHHQRAYLASHQMVSSTEAQTQTRTTRKAHRRSTSGLDIHARAPPAVEAASSQAYYNNRGGCRRRGEKDIVLRWVVGLYGVLLMGSMGGSVLVEFCVLLSKYLKCESCRFPGIRGIVD